MVSSFSSLFRHREGGFSDTNLQEVNRTQAEGEGQFELKLSLKVKHNIEMPLKGASCMERLYYLFTTTTKLQTSENI